MIIIYALAFLSGIVIFINKITVEINNFETIILIVLFIFSIIIYKKFNKVAITIIFIIFGYFWTLLFSFFILTDNISQKYHNKYVDVTGVITSLVDSKNYKDSFIFQAINPFSAKLKLAIYGKKRPKVEVGQKWQFKVKIKTNNSLKNLASFDYEKWLFLQRIDATGYININKPYKFIQQTNISKINQIRQIIRNKLLKVANNIKFIGVINAILIGDKSLIKKQHKDILKKTGTSHLGVISGLHLSIIASVIFILTGLILSRITILVNYMPIIIISAVLTIIATMFYMLLANFSIPTQRAFIMIAIFMLAIILRNRFNRWQLYGIALMIVLIINPLAILGVGFWLSFIVAGIIIYFINLNKIQNNLKGKIKHLIYLQLIITLIMSPIIVWFFGTFSLLSPLANLIAIPIFSLFIVPLSFLGLLFTLVNLDYGAHLSFVIIDNILIYLFNFLQFLSSSGLSNFNYSITDNFQLLVLIMALIMLISFKKLNLRILALIILMAMITNPKSKNNNFYILDVGQGLANIFTFKEQAIIFDTGNKFRSGFNMGEAVISPFLRAKNITKIHKIIISHNDKDHIGGLDYLINNYQITELITTNNNKCQAQNSWKIGDWDFKILATDNKFKGNNLSCVIKISNNDKSILLTGDIEMKVENYLIDKYGDTLKSDILIVPHHGSKTSSSLKFLKAVNPKIAIISAGFQNSYGHPAKIITQRYKELKIKLLTTICSGQISINLTDFSISEYRKDEARYYHRICMDKIL